MIKLKVKVFKSIANVTFITAWALLALALFSYLSASESFSNEPGFVGHVGSESCRNCHVEHYDGWRETVHGKMVVPAELFVADNLVRKAFEDEISTGSPRIKLNYPGQGQGPPASSWKDVELRGGRQLESALCKTGGRRRAPFL